MKQFAAMFVGGAVTIFLLKLLMTLMLPLLGMLAGLFFTALKLVLLATLAYFVYSLVFKRKKRREREA